MALIATTLLLLALHSEGRPDEVAWNKQDAEALLLLSFSAYCGGRVNATFDCYWCNKLQRGRVKFVGSFAGDGGGGGGDAAFAFVSILDGSKIVVSYRGTDNGRGWLKDFDLLQTHLPGAPSNVQVHEGFLGIALNASAPVAALIQKALTQCPSCDVVFTGHSLGGGLAPVGAALYNLQTGRTGNVHSFAGPRAGNPDFAQWLTGRPGTIFRVTSHHDPVPRVPPTGLPLVHYQHSPQEIWDATGDATSFTTCSATNGEDPNCIDSVHVWNLNPLDHASYMGYNALDGVLNGCLYTDPDTLSIMKLIRR